MNWAVEHEVPHSQKATHDQVHYEPKSLHEGKQCGNCKNFIRQPGEHPRCRTVQGPIAAPAYCVRWKAKETA